MTPVVPRWERLLAGTVLFVFICGMPFSWLFVDPSQGTKDMLSDERTMGRLLWLPCYLAAVGLALSRVKQLGPLMLRNGMLLLLHAMALVSVVWSIYPGDTVRRSIGLMGTTLFGMYLGERFGTTALLRLLAFSLMPAMGLSILTAVAVPDYGTMAYDGGTAWRGLFSHKNNLGLTMLLAIVVFVLAARADKPRRVLYGAGFAAAVGLLYLSHSFTPVMVGMIVLPVYAFLDLIRRPSVFARAAATVAALAAGLGLLFLLLNLEDFFASAGKDFTLTGRTLIWILVWSFIQDSFWFGYGYQAFWLAPDTPAASVWDHLEWEFHEAHNGYLEIWIGLGAVGMALVAVSFAQAFWVALKEYRRAPFPDGAWHLLFLLLFVFVNVTESHILIQNDAIWVLYVVTVFALAKWQRSLVRAAVPSAWRTGPMQWEPIAS